MYYTINIFILLVKCYLNVSAIVIGILLSNIAIELNDSYSTANEESKIKRLYRLFRPFILNYFS